MPCNQQSNIPTHAIAQGIWPQGKVDRLGPARAQVKQLLVRALQEVSDGLLGNIILEVSAHATKSKLLSCVLACLSEGVVLKLPVVAVIMEDFYSMFVHVLLKGKLGSKCFD
jgi:hypothetical protein